MHQINDAHRKNEVPIIAGGTSYYIQHLIFPNRLASCPPTTSESSTSSTRFSPEILQILSKLPPALRELFNSLPEQPPSAATCPEEAFSLHSLLTWLDPAVAARWHWKDSRKVLRCLKILSDAGRRPSEIFSEQAKIDLVPRSAKLNDYTFSDTTPHITDIARYSFGFMPIQLG
jgi:tRNA dimethylallyltransferase